ncbi:hypothetical protein TELCIR_00372 [Teladorsagia circumcincta]|uniref:MADF domain-containing protein n=1 Tax=Teladorsagia circumcincta TaxID=45464 RepID=A0A2G9V693_TELCI|nr:hypothetical protein TELCIR_00372 [Teladorsagia circumcincta]
MKLIEFVRAKESIWNPKFPEYSKPDLKCAAWQHVQAQMKAEGFDFSRTYPQQRPTRMSKKRHSEDSDVNDDVEMSDEDWHAGTSADSNVIHEEDSLANTGTDVEVEASPKNEPLPFQKASRPHLGAEFDRGSFVYERYKQMEQLNSTSGDDRGGVSSTGDKFDKYAAFLCSVLREMPEKESKKKMKDIMFILLEL